MKLNIASKITLLKCPGDKIDSLLLQSFQFFDIFFYTPVFRRDVLWYGDVRPSVRHSFPHFSPTCFEILSWNFVYHFILMHVRSSSNAINFPSIFAGVMPLLNFTLLQICSFPHISHTCFDILSWNFAYDFVLLYFRSSLSVVNLRQFLLELHPFWNLENWKYTVFRTFLLQALTYWAEIFHMTLFYFTTDQVWVSSICKSIFVGVMPLLELTIQEIHSFPHFSHTFFDIELKFYIWLCFTVLQIKFECRQFASIFVGVMPLLELTLLEIHSLPHFSPTCFGHIELKFFIWFCQMYYRLSLSVITLCQSGSPSVHLFSALSSYMHWQI